MIEKAMMLPKDLTNGQITIWARHPMKKEVKRELTGPILSATYPAAIRPRPAEDGIQA